MDVGYAREQREAGSAMAGRRVDGRGVRAHRRGEGVRPPRGKALEVGSPHRRAGRRAPRGRPADGGRAIAPRALYGEARRAHAGPSAARRRAAHPQHGPGHVDDERQADLPDRRGAGRERARPDRRADEVRARRKAPPRRAGRREQADAHPGAGQARDTAAQRERPDRRRDRTRRRHEPEPDVRARRADAREQKAES